jgi:hypothetical protein
MELDEVLNEGDPMPFPREDFWFQFYKRERKKPNPLIFPLLVTMKCLFMVSHAKA